MLKDFLVFAGTHTGGSTAAVVNEQRYSKGSSRSHGMMLLTLLTANVFLFWTPMQIYLLVATFADVYTSTVFSILGVLYNIQAILDPILLTLSQADFRISLKRIINPCH